MLKKMLLALLIILAVKQYAYAEGVYVRIDLWAKVVEKCGM